MSLVQATSRQMDEPADCGPGVLRHLLRVIDLLNLGVLVLDREGRIMFANRTARALLQIRAGQSLDSTVGAEISEDDRSLGRRLKTAMSRSEHAAKGRVSPSAASDKSVITLAIRCGDNDASPAEPAAVMFVSDPAAELEIDLDAVARLYRLTGAETRLLGALLKGGRISDYSRDARITLNTAKGYLKQLFSKTHTTRQSELVRSILANPLLRLVSTQAIGAERGKGGVYARVSGASVADVSSLQRKR